MEALLEPNLQALEGFKNSTPRWKFALCGFLCFIVLVLIIVLSVELTPAFGIGKKKVGQMDTKTSSNPPNIVFILADDLGWGNVGFHNSHNQQINTPFMDNLAATGVQLERMYVFRGCAPSRSSFQSGRLPVHVTMDNGDGITTPNHGIPAEMTGIASKLKEAHYSTHLVGKWDAGFASFAQIPINKGYDSFYGYLGKVISYFDKTSINDCPNLNDRDLWHNDKPAVDLDVDDDTYIEFIFRDKVLEIIDNHDPNGESPLFLLYSSHLPHYPEMVPQEFLEDDHYRNDENQCSQSIDYVFPGHVDGEKFQCRTILQSQVNLLDVIVGQIVDKLKETGLWDDTLFILQSDNGGHIQLNTGAGNNFPLRGGKETDFDGGIRAVSVVNGGYLPDDRRGRRESGLMHIADWYTTFCGLAGVDPTDWNAVESGLPDIDGLDMWPLLSGQSSVSPRTEIIVSEHALIMAGGDKIYKLMVGNHYYAIWGSEVWPDQDTPTQDELKQTKLSCTKKPCLFDLVEDESERNDIAGSNYQFVVWMVDKLENYKKGFYENNRIGTDSCPDDYELTVTVGKTYDNEVALECGCWMSQHNYVGFDGPYQDLEEGDIYFSEEGPAEIEDIIGMGSASKSMDSKQSKESEDIDSGDQSTSSSATSGSGNGWTFQKKSGSAESSQSEQQSEESQESQAITKVTNPDPDPDDDESKGTSSSNGWTFQRDSATASGSGNVESKESAETESSNSASNSNAMSNGWSYKKDYSDSFDRGKMSGISGSEGITNGGGTAVNSSGDKRRKVLGDNVKAVLNDKRFVRYLYIAIGLSVLMVGLCLIKCMIGSRVESIAKRANHEVVLSYGAVKV